MKGQENLMEKLSKIFEIFKGSGGLIKPHFILTGPSGSGKSLSIESLCNKFELTMLEINAAQLTKEGTSGNSVSKVLSPLAKCANKLTVCFVDEFDKLFISGNTNSELAHETTNGVQNEFLKILEGKQASVFADYGKYVNVPVNNILFVFAGAFNGEEGITIDRLREMGVKTEFIGRVGLVFNTNRLSLESLVEIFKSSPLLKMYLDLFKGVEVDKVHKSIIEKLTDSYDNNTLGARLINTLIHQYFVNGGKEEEVKHITFQKQLEL